MEKKIKFFGYLFLEKKITKTPINKVKYETTEAIEGETVTNKTEGIFKSVKKRNNNDKYLLILVMLRKFITDK